ncbi:hypothetical protein [Streptomyces jumonjinensis]|uniref:hypothetical protein n=1 Tax=Streptomyces jumonjinensis TaxID=1945 RepID=UPI0037896DC0
MERGIKPGTSGDLEARILASSRPRVLASYELHAVGRADLLGPDYLIPVDAPRDWAKQNDVSLHNRARLPAYAWRNYADGQLRDPESGSTDN